MKSTVILLLFTTSLILGINGFRRLNNIEALQFQPNSKVEPNVYQFNYKETDFLGGTTQFTFNAKTMSHVIPLDTLDGEINGFSCHEDRLVISFEEISLTKGFKKGSIITASTRFGCVDETGNSIPVYRQIESISYLHGGKTLIIQTQIKTFVDCFENAHFKLTYEPAPNASQLLDAMIGDENVVDEQIQHQQTVLPERNVKGIGSKIKKIGKKIGDTIGKGVKTVGDTVKKITQELEKILKVDISGKIEKSLDVFKFNYNPSSGSASKSINILNKQWKGNNFVSVDCANCYAYLVAGIHLEVKIGLDHLIVPKLKYFRASAFGEFKINVDATAKGSFDFQSLQNQITIFETTLGSITFMVGPIPVVIVPSISLDAYVEFTAGANGNMAIGFDYKRRIEMGVEYKDGHFGSIKSDTGNEYNTHPLTYTFSGKANFNVYVIPEIELSLYGIVPIAFSIEPYIGVDAQTGKCGNQFTPFYQLYYGLDFSVGLHELKFGTGNLAMHFGNSFQYHGSFISKRNIGCSWCSGCIKARSTLEISQEFKTLTTYTVKEETVANYTEQCLQQTNCKSCLSVATCGWCANSNVCTPGTLDGPSDGSCSYMDWNLDDCIINEDDIIVTSPVNGSVIVAGQNVTISWTGGAKNSKITLGLLRFDLDNIYMGAGLPIAPINNTGSYIWTVEAGIESNYWSIAVLSEGDTMNSNFSGLFFLDATYKNNTPIRYYWYTSMWSECNKECGGGVSQRDLYCLNSLGDGFNETFCAGDVPEIEVPCNVQSCEDTSLFFSSPQFDDEFEIDKVVNITWTGGKMYGKVYLRFRTNVDNDWKFGFGIPENAINNTGNFEWFISSDFPLANNVQLRIFSESLTSDNTATTFGKFELVKEVEYVITLVEVSKVDLEIQLFGVIGNSPVFIIPAGQKSITVKFTYIGSLISVGINDKNFASTSWDGNLVTITYLGKEEVVEDKKILIEEYNDFSPANIALIVVGSIGLIAIIIGAVFLKRRSNARKARNNDKYHPLIEQQ